MNNIRVIQTLSLLVALLVSCNVSSAKSSKNPSPVPEYCGQTSKRSLDDSFTRWDCSAIKIDSIQKLKALIKETHKLPSTGVNYYESFTPQYSVWFFEGNKKAVRYRAIYDGDSWKGVGVTTFCSDAKLACSAYEDSVVQGIPDWLFIYLGPPAPSAPPIVH